jgi:hypothetical protein
MLPRSSTVVGIPTSTNNSEIVTVALCMPHAVTNHPTIVQSTVCCLRVRMRWRRGQAGSLSEQGFVLPPGPCMGLFQVDIRQGLRGSCLSPTACAAVPS